MFLTPDELAALTGKKQALTQARWLADKGVPFRLEDRRVIVLKDDTVKWVHGEPLIAYGGIDWSTVD